MLAKQKDAGKVDHLHEPLLTTCSMPIHEAYRAISHLDTSSIIENIIEPRGSDICFLLLGMSWELVFCLDQSVSAYLLLQIHWSILKIPTEVLLWKCVVLDKSG